MKKFVNHVDHVAWVSHPETIEANVSELEALSGARLTRFQRDDMGLILYISWEAGLEVMAPSPKRTEANQPLRDWLETRGEGMMFVIFGVRDLEAHKTRLEALGFEVGPLVDDHESAPWHHQLVLRERQAGLVMNTNFVLGDIDYADSVVAFGDA
jgi:hypothetical protein